MNKIKSKKLGDWQDYGMRMYSPWQRRFPTPDPLIVYGQEYPELSTYQFASNSPIMNIDLDGLEGTDANRKFLFKQMNEALNNYSLYVAEKKYCEKYFGSTDCPSNVKPTDFSKVRNDVRNNAPDWMSDWNLVKGNYKFKSQDKVYTAFVYMNVERNNPSVSYVEFTNLAKNPNGEFGFFDGSPQFFVKFWKNLPNEPNSGNNYLVAYLSFDNKEDFMSFKKTFFENVANKIYESMEFNVLPETIIEDKIKSRPNKKSENTTNNSTTDSGEEVCFLAGTEVFTFNGLKEIEMLTVGDTVWTYNPYDENVELSVVEEIHSSYSIGYVDLFFGKQKVSVTSSHPLYSLDINDWRIVRELKVGEKLKTSNGHVILSDIQIVKDKVKVYNITVSGNHNYFVSEMLVLVHNKNIK